MLLSLNIKRKQIHTTVTLVVCLIILYNYSDFVSSFFASASEVSKQNYCTSTAESTRIVSVNDENNSQAVTLRQNHLLMVQLASNPSTGYSWQLVKNNPKQLETIFVGPVLFPPKKHTHSLNIRVHTACIAKCA